MDQVPSWNDVPGEIFQTISTLLPVSDVRSARLACHTWRTHFSYRPVRIIISAHDLIGDIADIAAAFQMVMTAWHNIDLLHFDCSLCTAQERLLSQERHHTHTTHTSHTTHTKGSAKHPTHHDPNNHTHHAGPGSTHPSHHHHHPDCNSPNSLCTMHFPLPLPLALDFQIPECPPLLPAPHHHQHDPPSNPPSSPLSPQSPSSGNPHFHSDHHLPQGPHVSLPLAPSSNPSSLALPIIPLPNPTPDSSPRPSPRPLAPTPPPTASHPQLNNIPSFALVAPTARPPLDPDSNLEADVTILLPSPTTVRRWRLDRVLLSGNLFKLLSSTSSLVNGALLLNIGPVSRYPLPPVCPTLSSLHPLSTLPNLISLSLIVNTPSHIPLIASYPALRRLALFFDWDPTTLSPFGDIALSTLTSLSHLRNLSLKYLLPFPSAPPASSCLSGIGLAHLLAYMPHLSTLSLELSPQPHDTFTSLSSLSSLQSFEAIVYGHCPAISSLIHSLSLCPHLSSCHLHFPNAIAAIHAVPPPIWSLLGSRPSTTLHFHLSYPPTRHPLPSLALSRLSLLPNLRKLELENINLSRHHLAQLSHLSALHHLIITGTADEVTGVDVLAALLPLRQLRTLQLRLQRRDAATTVCFDDGIAVSLAASMPSLQSLQVEGMRCGVSAAGLAALWSNPKLSRVCINNGVFERVRVGRAV